MSSNNMVFLGTAYVNVDNLAGLVIGGTSCQHSYQVLFMHKIRNEEPLRLFESQKKGECAEFMELAVEVLKDRSDKEAAAALKRFVSKHAESVDNEEKQRTHGTATAFFDAIFKQVPKDDKESEEKKSAE